MTKEDIINEYIPFMVKQVLKECEPPKNQEELIQFSQELGRYILERVEGFEGLTELEQIRNN